MAGALAELAYQTLEDDFRTFKSDDIRIILLERGNRILTAFPPGLSQKAEEQLTLLGAEVRKNTILSNLEDQTIFFNSEGKPDRIDSHTIIWTAGIKGTKISEILALKAKASIDNNNRILVNPDLTLSGYPNIFVIGDLAKFSHQGELPLPAIAPVAMQQGRYVANLIQARLGEKTPPPFRYHNKGLLSVIGRNAAIADFGWLRLGGFFAWLLWIFVHIAYLIEYDNKIIVLFQWAWNYFTRRRHSRLIIGKFAFKHNDSEKVPEKKRDVKMPELFS